jgi:hypothetical protein
MTTHKYVADYNTDGVITTPSGSLVILFINTLE